MGWTLFRGRPVPEEAAETSARSDTMGGCPGCGSACEEGYLILMPNAENLYGFCEKCVDLRLLMWCIERWRGRPAVVVRTTMTVAPPDQAAEAVRLDPQRAFSGLQKKEIYLRANGHCQGCGAPLDSDWHADHIFPHSRGGRTEVVNGQSLCQPCNRRKSAKVLTVEGGEG